MEILTAFVRERARWRGEDSAVSQSGRPPTDVAAILTVIRRREHESRKREKREGSLTDLREASLAKAHLEGALLVEAHLERANLFEAHLQKAFLAKAHRNHPRDRGMLPAFRAATLSRASDAQPCRQAPD